MFAPVNVLYGSLKDPDTKTLRSDPAEINLLNFWMISLRLAKVSQNDLTACVAMSYNSYRRDAG